MTSITTGQAFEFDNNQNREPSRVSITLDWMVRGDSFVQNTRCSGVGKAVHVKSDIDQVIVSCWVMHHRRRGGR